MVRVKHGSRKMVHKQETGEITAWFTSTEEKKELVHRGSAEYRRAFYLLIITGLLYLGAVFGFVH